MSGLYVERVWLIECTRCSNEHVSGAITADLAESECEALGWTAETGDQFCPGCNGARA